MKWLLEPSMILGAATLVFAFLYQATSHELEVANVIVASQKKTVDDQVRLIVTLQTQDAQNRTLIAAQQLHEQQLRQQNDVYQRKYREAIKNDPCAGQPLPGAVLELLRPTASATAGAAAPSSP
ncbi:Protein of uncharacterised function (DUF2570) [Serratia entomophila]|nr:Protein of uncharacterised function (DUF2570) [Serratia entomophila]CAI1701504.1 Protein of uncharacterised function (DUF2570) [Serratia entomophila]CAI2448233.1 Protein of uncharacterised function (DUF2570) [Serratia entomophila]